MQIMFLIAIRIKILKRVRVVLRKALLLPLKARSTSKLVKHWLIIYKI